MYKSSSKQLFYKKKRKKNKFSLLKTLMGLPLSLVVIIVIAEILTRVYFNVTGKTNELTINNKKESKELSGYTLKFVNRKGENLLTNSQEGNLKVERKLTSGYEIVGKQKSEFWQINEQGFRDNEPVPLNKPKDEIRIFLLGGSSAFGYLNSNNNNTIAHQLEQKLQERVKSQKSRPEIYRPDVFPFFKPLRVQAMAKPAKIKEGKYRVINAAIPGYTSANQLAQFALEIIPYQPDLIIVLDGYGDLMLPSEKEGIEIPNIEKSLTDKPVNFQTYLQQYLDHKLSQIYLVKLKRQQFQETKFFPMTQSLVVKENDNKPLKDYLPQNDNELKKRIERYQENQKKLSNLTTKINIPLIFALQPEITGKKPEKLAPSEKEILQQLGPEYTQKIKSQYPKFANNLTQLAKSFPNNVKFINLYEVNDKYPNPTFVDAVHLTDKANQVLADQLYNSISSLEKMQIIPQFFYLKNNK